ncbi:transforming growth factor beta-1-induced transcript 1 protein isoform X4 [Pteropus medius]|uniref:transforming growth factor beta-1-induced transcript 1 protein isoform X4 n=1 Tax=Pteropus vampyrus TaxID=132908 RepID=UPI00196A82DA|nr:transforming growth factor beta-1-induced transcript 1 protein isoform X4 [Pteropus giganteus]
MLPTPRNLPPAPSQLVPASLHGHGWASSSRTFPPPRRPHPTGHGPRPARPAWSACAPPWRTWMPCCLTWKPPPHTCQGQELQKSGPQSPSHLPCPMASHRWGRGSLQEPLRTRTICTAPTLFPSTVCKPRSPKPAAPAAPPFSSSSGVLGTGLCELDRLLQELNATQFNITDEIMSQFPSSKETAGELKEDQSEDKKRPSLPSSPSPVLPKTSATSATLELDRLMASLSDFRVQNHLPASGPTQPPVPSSTNEGSPSPPGPTGKGSLDTMLGLLQSDLTRRGIPTQAKGLCGSCNKHIAGQVVTALGRAWHPEHFVCSGCSVALGGSSFFEKDGAPFCPECYFQRFSPRCGLCNQPIRHKMVTALGTHWHPEHFCCVSCGEPFGDEGFHEREGRPYCRQDFLQLFAPRCQGCQGPILDNYISALSALWHPDCFVCRQAAFSSTRAARCARTISTRGVVRCALHVASL